MQDHSNKQQANAVLEEAQAHLNVLPIKSFELLRDNNYLLVALDRDAQARWHFIMAQSASRMSDLDILHKELLLISAYSDTQFYQQHQSRILNALGIWFRRSGYFEFARRTYLCSLASNSAPKDQLNTMLNLAVVERNLGHLDEAMQMNDMALQIAQENENGAAIAVINNNLGVIAFAQKRLDDAKQYFETAMYYNQLTQRRFGEILSGNNLMLTFLSQEKLALFDRLAPRIERLLKRSSNVARKAYFDVLMILRKHDNGQPMSENSRKELLAAFNSTNDTSVQHLLRDVIESHGVSAISTELDEPKVYTGDIHQHFAECDWQKYTHGEATNMLKFSQSP